MSSAAKPKLQCHVESLIQQCQHYNIIAMYFITKHWPYRAGQMHAGHYTSPYN